MGQHCTIWRPRIAWLSRLLCCTSQESDTCIAITELPIRKWTQDYKEYLEGLIKPENAATRPLLVDYKEFHSGAHVHFELQPAPGAVPEADDVQLLAKFKLTTKISLSESESASTAASAPELLAKFKLTTKILLNESGRLTCCPSSSSSSPPRSPSVSPTALAAASAPAGQAQAQAHH